MIDFDYKPFVFLDGATGTELQKRGLRPGECPELWNMTRPGAVRQVHKSYVAAGSDIIYANTFGCNAKKLRGSGFTVAQVAAKGVELARSACKVKGFVALDIGPLGELLYPNGSLHFEDAYAQFKELSMAGEAAGADLAVVETMTDLAEARAAVLAVKENTALPVFVCMSFESSGRTFFGCTAESFATVFHGLDVDALGINCSLGPAEILPIVRRIAAVTDKPLIVKANAGLPDPVTGQYSIDAEEFARAMRPYADLGVQFLGGCCGTDPSYIKALRETFRDLSRWDRKVSPGPCVCAPARYVPIDRPRVIGERINPTGKARMKQALEAGDLDYIAGLAIDQAEAGAEILDINVGHPGIDEAEMMRRVVEEVQAVCSLPLQIDSADPAALEAGLRAAHGKCIVNSVNGEAAVLDAVLPLVKKYGAAVVGLTLDEKGIPETAEARLEIAQRILEAAEKQGIPKSDVYIDCLTLTVSAQQAAAGETLRALALVKEKLGLKTVLGVSNISFGLPARELMNRSFFSLALGTGLDLPILNPCSAAMMDTLAAFRVLHGEDAGSAAYIARFAEAPKPAPNGGAVRDVAEVIRLGLRAEAGPAALHALADGDAFQVIDGQIIPALDAVGRDFESGTLFLPQLLASAEAAAKVFEVIQTKLPAAGPVSKGEVVVATVQGDIHDIGKNIVKVVLESYGYTVTDLGRDVPPARIVEAAGHPGVALVGLSALMTTTLPAMARTLDALKAAGLPAKTMVGGAVLSAEWARTHGADFYVKDAAASVEAARQVYGGK